MSQKIVEKQHDREKWSSSTKANKKSKIFKCLPTQVIFKVLVIPLKAISVASWGKPDYNRRQTE